MLKQSSLKCQIFTQELSPLLILHGNTLLGADVAEKHSFDPQGKCRCYRYLSVLHWINGEKIKAPSSFAV